MPEGRKLSQKRGKNRKFNKPEAGLQRLKNRVSQGDGTERQGFTGPPK